MAANLILFDRNADLTRPAVRGMQLVREGLLVLEQVRATYVQSRDGDGSDAAHYDLTASEGGYEAGDYASAAAAAQASFDEIDSLYSKIGGNGSVSNVRDAIFQACAKHGV